MSAPQRLHLVQHPLGRRRLHVADDAAVGQEDDLVAVAGRHRVVGDHHHGLAQRVDRAPQEPEQLRARPRVEVAGGLVGEYHRRAAHQGAGGRDPLLLTPGELGRPMPQPVPKPHRLHHPLQQIPVGPAAGDGQRELDVLGRGEGREQVEGLEDEPDPVAAQAGQPPLVEPGQLGPAEPDPAPVDGLQAGEAVQQGGLARPGGAHHGAEAVAGEPDRDAVQRGDHGRPGAVGLGDLDGGGGELDGPGGGREGVAGRHDRSCGRGTRPARQPQPAAGRTGVGARPGGSASTTARGSPARYRWVMGIRTAWQAIAQSPRSFLTSSWPWRSLGYLLCGIAPSAAVAAGVLAFVSLPSSRAAPVVLPLVALALLLSGPVVTRYERWRLRLMEAGPPPVGRRAEGAGPRALETGYGVVCVVVLWLIDLAVVALSLFLPVGLTVTALRSADAGAGVQAAMLAVALLLAPLAAYPITAWAGARSALARVVLAREPELDESLVEVTRSRARLVDASHEQAKQALAELRELLHGVHPQVLTDRGLPAAVADAAGRSPLAAATDVVLPRRLPAGVEVAAYFAVCEALANVTKHSRASQASVRGRLVDGTLVLEVCDDGIGGADPAGGSGLTGLADRGAAGDGPPPVFRPARG